VSIFSRLTDIINSNLNAVLARAEDPEKMIRLMVQEMEDTLVEVRAAAARIIADRKTAERQLARLGEAQAEWQRRAELALRKDREDLARGALLEKAKLAEAAKALKEELEYLDDALARYDEDIAKLEDKLREAKAKQKALVARHATATHRLRVRQQVHDRRIDDAFVRFEQMERRVEAAEGEVESFDLGRGRTLGEEIADLEADAAIREELEALKARVRGGTAGSSG
jgi:phage shock protein A